MVSLRMPRTQRLKQRVDSFRSWWQGDPTRTWPEEYRSCYLCGKRSWDHSLFQALKCLEDLELIAELAVLRKEQESR